MSMWEIMNFGNLQIANRILFFLLNWFSQFYMQLSILNERTIEHAFV